jgi:3-oxoacyl-[acyl-carrier-protein] synthase-3
MYVPPIPVHNDALSRAMDTSHEWIQVRTGIEERRLAEEGASSDMAVPAAQDAIADAGLETDDIDYLIFATMTPDYYFPGSAPFLQRKMGLPNMPCLDIRQQCAGFIYGLQLADALVRSAQYSRVLVVGAEVHSCLQPWNALTWDVVMGRKEGPVPKEDYDHNTSFRDRTVLFGDGAGAMVVEASEDDDRGIIDGLIHTNGDEAERLWTPAGGSAFRPYFEPEMWQNGDTVPIVEGRKVYALAVTLMPEVTIDLLQRNDLTVDDVDLFVMHQANLRINEGVQKRLGVPDERVFNNIQRYGNTTAATIPIAYHEARQQGRVKEGDLVCFVGLGSGLNWGAVLHRC